MPSRGHLLGIGLAGLAIIGAFLLGRQSKPTRVEEKVRVEKVEVEKQVVVVQERVRVQTVEIIRHVEVARRTERQVSHPDGRVEITRTEETEEKTDAEKQDAAELSSATRLSSEQLKAERLHRESSLEYAAARWKLGATAGVDLTTLLSSPSPIFGGTGALRLGPFWLGAWAMTNRTAGISAEVQF